MSNNELNDKGLDSGVASAEATPDGQLGIMVENISSKLDDNAVSSTTSSLLTAGNFGEVSSSQDSKGALSIKASNIASKLNSTSQDEEDDDIDETLGERLFGLTEMFPESLRNVSSKLFNTTCSFISKSYDLSRNVIWIGVSTSVILFAPVMFEIERYNVEELVRQDRNKLVLGPGSAMSGSSGGVAGPPGMPPPPTR